ncbi:hypothetical protein [Pseudomaricurvus sp. HS19]|uniref:hypothetical protein n=1 Tax=Pseudomaricurvus sp. HS19 TaxID=2692626 RepID=UPI00136FC8C5|nr:hypothetical protein [Pseudomaricurvus sp. HS19]MYM64429.1 hypothetical protein [Pseudomaricurvus sp. HS19]
MKTNRSGSERHKPDTTSATTYAGIAGKQLKTVSAGHNGKSDQKDLRICPAASALHFALEF